MGGFDGFVSSFRSTLLSAEPMTEADEGQASAKGKSKGKKGATRRTSGTGASGVSADVSTTTAWQPALWRIDSTPSSTF
jgi:hypothetical protein